MIGINCKCYGTFFEPWAFGSSLLKSNTVRVVGLLILLLTGAFAQENERLRSILARLSGEAETFTKTAPQLVATETLHQRAKPVGNKRPAAEKADKDRPTPSTWQNREIVSEYAFASLRGAPEAIREFRQVVSVDGQPVTAPEAARQKLAAALKSASDRGRKQMLESFERHGLVGTASDFGQLLLLFTKQRLDDYNFQLFGYARLGAEGTVVVNYKEQKGAGSLTIFENGKTLHRGVVGRFWAKDSDFLPLRITLNSERAQGKSVRRDEAEVDYTMTPHGVLWPAAVVHREFLDGALVAENIFQYSNVRRRE